MPLTTFEKVVLCAATVAIILGATIANCTATAGEQSDAANLYGVFMHERTKPWRNHAYSRGTISIEEVD
jgi:hypothetical protein